MSFPPYHLSIPFPPRYAPFHSLPLNPIVYLLVSNGSTPALNLFPHHLQILICICGYSADAANNSSRRLDEPCNPCSRLGVLTTYHVYRMFSTTNHVGRTFPSTYPIDQMSNTGLPVGQIYDDVLLAFDRLPDTFLLLLNLQNLQLATS